MKCNHFTCHSCPPEYTFRGGYIEDASGERWWSAELLARAEKERDEARAALVSLQEEYEIMRQDNERLRATLEDFAEYDCHYGDNCPSNAGTRHGTCVGCKARQALEKKP